MRRIRIIRLFVLLSLAAVILTSCGPSDIIDQAQNAINTSISQVQSESAAWRNVVPALGSQLNTMVQTAESQGNNDAANLLTNLANQVNSMASDSIKLAGLTGDEFIARFGSEARCNVDFIQTRIKSDLNSLVQAINFWKANKHTLPTPPPHSVCQVTPDKLELSATGTSSVWTMTSPTDKIIGIYGYDFRHDALPTVELDDANGKKIRDAMVSSDYVTRYQINLNFASEQFMDVPAGAQYVLDWPDQPEPNAISVTLNSPPQLTIKSAQLNPSIARAKVSQVSAQVTVENNGGSSSQSFNAIWDPGEPGQKTPETLTEPGLAPGAVETFIFDPYVYSDDGVYDSVISIANGSSTEHIAITVTPYANNPAVQSQPMQGQWPGSGGDPGQTKLFPITSIPLGKGCVIDASRGGGSFQLGDPNHPGTPYTVSWPRGYDFSFNGPGTIFSSLYSLTASYDAQANQVTAAVTLKGLGGHGFLGSRGPERFAGTFIVYSLCPS